MIERYLVELRRALGFAYWPKERLVLEVEDHLRSAAADVGEEEALRRFGPPEAVAGAFRARMAWLYAAAAVAFALGFPVVSYPVVENTLPPAPWPTDAPPDYLRWKQTAILQLFFVALAAASVAAVAWRRGGRVRSVGAAAATAALAAMATLGVVLSVQWADAVPGTPAWHPLLWVVQLFVAGTGGVLLVRAVRSESFAQEPEDAADDLAL